jgi:hypothetical protein
MPFRITTSTDQRWPRLEDRPTMPDRLRISMTDLYRVSVDLVAGSVR